MFNLIFYFICDLVSFPSCLCVRPCSQSTCEQHKRRQVGPLQYLFVLEARVGG